MSAGHRLDHGRDCRSVQRRHDNAVLGKSDQVARQLAIGISGDADYGAAPLNGNREIRVALRCARQLVIVAAFEDGYSPLAGAR